jgi:glycosyltransferase involved in cell wall biosynthesis
MSNKVAVVLPAYNEGAVIHKVVKDLRLGLKKTGYEFEVVVVDDGSNDDTSTQAEKAGANVIRHILNTGSGGATATGLSYAQQKGFDIAATMDADGQHITSDVINGINVLLEEGGDLLIGSRLMDPKGMSKVKVLGNKGLTLITQLLFGIDVTDSQSGLRVFSRRALEKLKWKTSGYEFCSEMLWRAKQQKLAIKEFPIQAVYTEYSQKKGQNNWNAFNIVKSLLQRRFMEFFGE